MKKTAIILILMLSGLTNLAAQTETAYEGVIFCDNEPWAEVLDSAYRQQKLIFMDCYTEWCGPCKMMGQNVFPLKEVGDFFNANFINVKYDMEKGDGAMLREKYRPWIEGYPSLLLINPEGEVIHRMLGYRGPEELIDGMRAGMEGRTLDALIERYEAGARDLETISDYVVAQNRMFRFAEMREAVYAYLETVPVEALLEPDVWALTGKYIDDPSSEAYAFVLANLEKYRYGLKVDIFKLEEQLGSAMKKAVRELLNRTLSDKNTDSPEMLLRESAMLQQHLGEYELKKFPIYKIKLLLNDHRLRGEANAFRMLFGQADSWGFFAGDNDFLVPSYLYIVDNSRDKNILRSVRQRVEGLQQAIDEAEDRGPMSGNYYEVIARACEKLGDTKAAATAMENYRRRVQERKEFFDENIRLINNADKNEE